MQSTLSPCSTSQVKEHPKMRNRRHTLLWMKDLIEHMSRCHDQLQWASDGDTQSFLADALIGDLNECQKLCEQLRSTAGSPEPIAGACRLVTPRWSRAQDATLAGSVERALRDAGSEPAFRAQAWQLAARETGIG